MSSESFVTVFQAASLLEAEMVKGLLEGEGLMASIPGEHATDPFTSTREITGGRQLTVEVPDEQAAKARAIIEAARESGKALEGKFPDDES